MSHAICVENLGKRYRIVNRTASGGYQRFSESLASWAKAPFRAFGKPKSQAGVGNSADEFWALRDLNFTVQPGEKIGIIGRNGAGKSTLLKLLSRITEPTTGRITLRGRVASLLEVGTGFHPELTGRENVFMNGAILGMTRQEIKSRMDDIVSFAEVESFLDVPVKRYSSGMQLRLAFSVAAHLDPEILVVDEVLAVGDAAFQQKCMNRIDKAVSEQGSTVVFVSHNLDSILRLADRTMVLESGKVAFSGSARAGVEHYVGNLAKHGDRVDLASAPRPSHIRGQARLIAAHPAERGVGSWNIPFGDVVGLDIDFEVTTELECCQLGLALLSGTGVEIASVLSSHSLPPTTLSPGAYRMCVRYPGLRLVPGLYTFGLGILSNRGQEDYLPQALQFSVVSSSTSAQMHTDGFRGHIVPETLCTLRPLPPK